MSAQPVAATAKAVAHRVERIRVVFMVVSFKKKYPFRSRTRSSGHDRETDRSGPQVTAVRHDAACRYDTAICLDH